MSKLITLYEVLLVFNRSWNMIGIVRRIVHWSGNGLEEPDWRVCVKPHLALLVMPSESWSNSQRVCYRPLGHLAKVFLPTTSLINCYSLPHYSFETCLTIGCLSQVWCVYKACQLARTWEFHVEIYNLRMADLIVSQSGNLRLAVVPEWWNALHIILN